MNREIIFAVFGPILLVILLWFGLMLLITSCWSPEHRDIPDKAYPEIIPQKEWPTPIPTPMKTAIEFENDDLKADIQSCREQLKKLDYYCLEVDYD